MRIFTRFRKTWTDIFSNISNYSFLIWQLLRVDVLVGYKKSYIGVLWMLIYPIFSVFIWVILNGAGVIEPGESSIPYPAYVLLSTSIWGFFIGIYQTISNVIINGGRLMIMNKFPIEVLVIRKILLHLVLFLIPFVVNITVLLIYGVELSWMSLLFPLTLIPLFAMGLALGLVVAVLRAVAVDIVAGIDEFLKVLMYLTPIVYTAKLDNSFLSRFIEWNPLAYLVGFSRDVLVSGMFSDTHAFLICSGGAFLACFLAIHFFLLVGPMVLERLVIN